MQICRDVEDWIQEQVEQTLKRQEKRCKKWPWPLSWFCSLVIFILKIFVWVWKKIIRVVCEVVAFIWNLIARVINFILLMPVIGPLIKAIIRFFSSLASYIIGLVDGLLRLIGIRITKHLRLHMVPLCRDNSPLAREANLRAIMEQTARTLYNRAQIRVHWTFQEPIRKPPRDMLRIGTEGDMIADLAWAKGSWYQAQVDKLFDSSAQRLSSIGQPIAVFIVEEVGYDGVSGASSPGVIAASAGPFVDWIAVEASSAIDQVVAGTSDPFPPTVESDSPAAVGTPNPNYAPFVIAHEVCHTLGLLGHANADPGDLMWPNQIVGDYLSPLQVGIIRSSSPVTYL